MAKLNGEGREKNWAWIVSSEKARTYWGEADPEYVKTTWLLE